LTTGALYQGLLWGLVPVALTLLLGRFFCGWVCPFGSLNHFVGYLAGRFRKTADRIQANRYHRLQAIKYWILLGMLGSALSDLVFRAPGVFGLSAKAYPGIPTAVFIGILLATGMIHRYRNTHRHRAWLFHGLLMLGLMVGFRYAGLFQGSLQTGLLDPIPLFHRSVDLILIPVLDQKLHQLSAASRTYEGAWLIGAIFGAALSLNGILPRFFCRFLCPLGALFGILSRFSLWRIGKTAEPCTECRACEAHCEGACAPSTSIIWGECVLCLNCINACRTEEIAYRPFPSAGGETPVPDLFRRGLIFSTLSGILAVPLVRAGGGLASNWNPGVVRPPGALPEEAFLSRCIKCGQCMRICPTHVIQPAGLQAGMEGLWTPVLNFRNGKSGCHHQCIACGHLCPTSAIRPLSFDERMGRKDYAATGPIRIGTAFIERGRCLPWAMDKPCIVCQENCPVSPKAIFTREHFAPLRIPHSLRIREAAPAGIVLQEASLIPGQFETGDFYCAVEGAEDSRLRRILKNSGDGIEIHPESPWSPLPRSGGSVSIHIRLQQPYVDIDRCIGCGVCEHECPVSGRRAIRVSAENESRNPKRALTFPKGGDTEGLQSSGCVHAVRARRA